MRDATVVLKYEIPAIRNSDFLTGKHTCILEYLYFLSLKAI
jgi:hypothetical protein